MSVLGLLACAQSHTYQISCVRISLDCWPQFSMSQPVISENTTFASIFKSSLLSFSSWLSVLGSSVRAESEWEKTALWEENSSDGKLQKVWGFRQRFKLIWTSLVWKLIRNSMKNLDLLVRYLADQSFSWVWSNLTMTFPALFPYFVFMSTANEKWQKQIMGFGMWGQALCLPILCPLSSTHLRALAENNKTPSQPKCPF